MPAISLSLQPPFSTAREGPTCLVRIAVSCCKVLPYSYQSAFFKKRESAIEVALPSAAVHVYTRTHLHTNVHAYRQIAAPRYAQVSHYSRSHSHSCLRTHVRTYAPRLPILRMSLFCSEVRYAPPPTAVRCSGARNVPCATRQNVFPAAASSTAYASIRATAAASVVPFANVSSVMPVRFVQKEVTGVF